ncbi:aspartyl-phosphate phosphatase Spo0E family protein [Amphibacillus sediminis]|uniref:aspartyl-phosphate phosphatase Spo0E family protein n=1 Tax=Amphibacillus sediminis TaxID=360185 RepID=UPI0009F99439|nr:aspartyl-phosphate phosphatase Spo0E family protein [Amphibacillus sediminis]
MDTSNLLERIEQLRQSMIEVATTKGYSSKESILISRELDELLNLYNRITGWKK